MSISFGYSKLAIIFYMEMLSEALQSGEKVSTERQNQEFLALFL